MHVHLVSPDHQYILNKLTNGIMQYGQAPDIQITRGDAPIAWADINYYFNWHVYTFHEPQPGIDLLWYTHLNTGEEAIVYDTIMRADHATCISSFALERLVNDLGVPRERLTLTLQPCDDGWQPRPIVVGMPYKCYGDGRRDEWMIVECAKRGAFDGYLLVFIGPGWEKMFGELSVMGIPAGLAQLSGDFTTDYETHHKIVPTLDYTLLCSQNDSIGICDGLACGVPTIHRRAGYALDFTDGLWFDTVDELEVILRRIKADKWAIGERVRARTWPVFVCELQALWRRLCV